MRPQHVPIPWVAWFVFSTSVAHAGANQAASVRFSWEPSGETSNLASAPTGPMQLYLLIDDAPAIRELALTTAWVPTEAYSNGK